MFRHLFLEERPQNLLLLLNGLLEYEGEEAFVKVESTEIILSMQHGKLNAVNCSSLRLISSGLTVLFRENC